MQNEIKSEQAFNAKVKWQRIHQINSTEELLHLMEIYLSEWEHRDSLFWGQAFSYFAAALTIIVLPFFEFWKSTGLYEKLPKVVFPIVGLIMSFLFLCIMLGYCKRMEVSHDIYSKLIKCLPPQYRRKQLKDDEEPEENETDFYDDSKKRKRGLVHFFTVHSVMKAGSIIMFVSLMALALFIIVITVINL